MPLLEGIYANSTSGGETVEKDARFLIELFLSLEDGGAEGLPHFNRARQYFYEIYPHADDDEFVAAALDGLFFVSCLNLWYSRQADEPTYDHHAS